MRRNHRPVLNLELAPHADNISLLFGAEADRGRWRSSPVSPVAHNQEQQPLQHRFSAISSEANDLGDDSDESNTAESDEPNPGFLGRMESYSRSMHARTKSQLESPTMGTIPSYNRTMQAFTLSQLNHYHRSSKSATSSPQPGGKKVQLPTKIDEERVNMTRVEYPRAPSNTPDHKHSCSWPKQTFGDVDGIDFRKLKRSRTEPCGGAFLLLKEGELAVA